MWISNNCKEEYQTKKQTRKITLIIGDKQYLREFQAERYGAKAFLFLRFFPTSIDTAPQHSSSILSKDELTQKDQREYLFSIWSNTGSDKRIPN